MNNKIKEIIAANREPLPSRRKAQERLADIIESVCENGGLELNNFTPYSDPKTKTLLEASQDHDREMHKGYQTSFAKLKENDVTREIFKGGRARMVFDIKK